MKLFALATAAMVALATPVAAQETFTATLTNDHEIAQNWNSILDAQGEVLIIVDGDNVEIVIEVDGITAADLATEMPGPFHIHNFPQGGENFIVQGFDWNITDTDTGILVTAQGPAPDALTGQDFDFVVEEMRNGNAYFAVHTVGEDCTDVTGETTWCAAPMTALAGTLE
jgi:hypothetical protein